MQETKYREQIREMLYKMGFNTNIEDDDLFSDIGMDSIIFIRLIIEIESKFNIRYPDEYLSFKDSGSIEKISVIVSSLISQKRV